jgi:hypothetical protein
MQVNKTRVLNMQNEQGGARLKFIVFIAVFAVILYVGYMYIPVAIDAYYYKDVMQNKERVRGKLVGDESHLRQVVDLRRALRADLKRDRRVVQGRA